MNYENEHLEENKEKIFEIPTPILENNSKEFYFWILTFIKKFNDFFTETNSTSLGKICNKSIWYLSPLTTTVPLICYNCKNKLKIILKIILYQCETHNVISDKGKNNYNNGSIDSIIKDENNKITNSEKLEEFSVGNYHSLFLLSNTDFNSITHIKDDLAHHLNINFNSMANGTKLHCSNSFTKCEIEKYISEDLFFTYILSKNNYILDINFTKFLVIELIKKYFSNNSTKLDINNIKYVKKSIEILIIKILNKNEVINIELLTNINRRIIPGEILELFKKTAKNKNHRNIILNTPSILLNENN